MGYVVRAVILGCALSLAACTTGDPGNADARKAQVNWSTSNASSGGGGSGGGGGY
jgi:hypothetical protein